MQTKRKTLDEPFHVKILDTARKESWVQSVSFDNPFFDELAKYPVRFSTPVFFGDSPFASYSAALRNGTGSLLKLKDKYLGVTCEHVLRQYRRLKEAQTVFHFGRIEINPEECLISENRDYDLVVFDLTRFVGAVSDFTGAKFVYPTAWPPRGVSREDVICLGGFPGIWREQINLGHLRFYSFSSGAGQVHAVGEHHLMTRFEVDKCVTQFNNGLVLGSLGGLSGGPVFVWRKEAILTAELVGFISEYQTDYDLMRVTSANLIQDNGSLV
ncbi:MAG: hypothetical protein DMG96_20835 [Acidobacteria bacterium]|nr:MAG: hypothetical protein DMG96_20835 [Acidobacteriota bacterium]